jgi:Mg2+/Co2+ transporter CorB
MLVHKWEHSSYSLNPFYRGSKVTVIGAINIKKVVALMTMNDSMDGNAFEVFVSKFLVPQLWWLCSGSNG